VPLLPHVLLGVYGIHLFGHLDDGRAQRAQGLSLREGGNKGIIINKGDNTILTPNHHHHHIYIYMPLDEIDMG